MKECRILVISRDATPIRVTSLLLLSRRTHRYRHKETKCNNKQNANVSVKRQFLAPRVYSETKKVKCFAYIFRSFVCFVLFAFSRMTSESFRSALSKSVCIRAGCAFVLMKNEICEYLHSNANKLSS